MVPRREEGDNAKFQSDEPNEDAVRGFQKKEEESLFVQQNGSISLELGEYKCLRIPGYLIGASFGFYPYLWTFDHDPRMDGLPLMHNIFPVMVICVIYMFFSLVWGPRIMKNRPPIHLKRVKIVYNLIQVIVCSYIFIEGGRLAWFWDYSYTCQPIDHSPEGKPFAITRIVYAYFLTKILDLLDTVFFILDKKWTHITLLHVGHHGGLVMGIYVGAKYSPGGHGTFIGFLNSFVHVLMYSYYFLAAMGPAVKPYLWWKKYLTIIQILQFVVIFLHALQVFFIDCPIQKSFQTWSCLYAFIFLYLFVDFYRNSYGKKPVKTENVTTNGILDSKSNGRHELKTE